MRLNTFAIAFSCCILLFGCKPKPEQNDEGAATAAAYQVVDVKDGGTISGVVTLQGVASSPEIVIQKDQDACGNSHSNPSASGSGKGVVGAVVYLEEIHSGKGFDGIASKANLDQKGCEFHPHIQILKSGAEVLVSNSDKALHNANFNFAGTSVSNFAQPEGTPPRPVTLEKAGLYSIHCEVHSWMRAFAFAVDNPYYAITDENGNYSLTNVPPGTYTLKLWRDNWALDEPKDNEGRVTGYKWGSDFQKEQKVTVATTQTVAANFSLP